VSVDSSRRKAIAFALTLGAAAVLAEASKPSRRDEARAKVPMDAIFPRRFADWGLDARARSFVQPPDEQGKLYGVYDQVLERAYLSPLGERVMLCVAYGSEQSPALQVHRPEVCYAAGGFRVSRVEAVSLEVGMRRLPATRLHAAKVGRSECITYWVVLGDAVIDGSQTFRWRQLTAGLRGEVRDGMVVRVSSIGPDVEPAYRLHAKFVNQLANAVSESFHQRVFGAANAA
jgi:EpsI family protein